MKYLAMSILAALFFSIGLSAQQPAAAPAKQAEVKKQADASKDEPVLRHDDWDFFQITFFPWVPTDSMDSKVYGVKLGLPLSTGKGCVWGVETSPVTCQTENVCGTQLAPAFNSCTNMSGLQASVVNVAKSAKGLQLGLVNVATDCGFQIGAVNYIEKGWLPICPIINFSF